MRSILLDQPFTRVMLILIGIMRTEDVQTISQFPAQTLQILIITEHGAGHTMEPKQWPEDPLKRRSEWLLRVNLAMITIGVASVYQPTIRWQSNGHHAISDAVSNPWDEAQLHLPNLNKGRTWHAEEIIPLHLMKDP